MTTDPMTHFRALIDVYEAGIVWQCLCAVARLEVPDRLADGPLPVSHLAADAGVQADPLFRVLRLLADHELVTLDGDRVALTDRGRLLCRAHPLSAWATFASVGPPDVAHALTDTLCTGRAAAERVLGVPFWQYLAAHPDQQAVFDEQMRQQAQVTSLTCVPVLPWPASGTIADIGGGLGTLLAAVLRTAPGVHGILVDQPHVLDRAERFLADQGIADRCTLHPGDLYAPPPPADMYLLARVLHDWGDDDAIRILTALAHSAADGTRLRLFEGLIPEDGTPHRTKMGDIAMMLLFGDGRERTATEFRNLLQRTGWRFDNVVASPGPMSVIEAIRHRQTDYEANRDPGRPA